MTADRRSILTTHDDFFRLTQNLRALKLDFNYNKTRKLLDPKWNGYNKPKDHDVIEDDVPIIDSNLVTSRIQDSDLHKVVLDLDYGAQAIPYPPLGHSKLELIMRQPIWFGLDGPLYEALNGCGIPCLWPPQIERLPVSQNGILHLHTERDLALIPSTTPGHHHLIIDVAIPWIRYINLLDTLANSGIIERGYAKAAISKGYSAIRPPWVKKKI